MKLRKEISGYHFFNRANGWHILMDEFRIPIENCSIVPRTVSIALTNACNLSCDYCYAEKYPAQLSINDLQLITKQLDKLGTLEITFGGGEPFLYKNITEICEWIWTNTSLGVTITTNGFNLSEPIIESISKYVSFIRFSIDGIDPYFQSVRKKPLNELLEIIEYTCGRIPFGINCTVRPGKLNNLIDVIELAKKINARNLMIIPEHNLGEFLFSVSDWKELQTIINTFNKEIELYLTADATNYLNVSSLETESPNERLFAHISADKKLKTHSYNKNGIMLSDLENLHTYFEQFYSKEN